MFGLVKKWSSREAVEKTERLPEDTSILSLRSKDELPLFRDSFKSVRGAVYPLQFLSPQDMDHINAFILPMISRGDLRMEMFASGEEIYVEHTNMNMTGFIMADDSPELKKFHAVYKKADAALGEIFKQAIGKTHRAMHLKVNLTYPAEFHTHGYPVLTYALQAPATIGEATAEYAFPEKHAVLMKRGFPHKAGDHQCRITPRLTFMVN